MRAVKDLRDVQIVLNELLDFKAAWESRNINLNGRRIINAGVAVDASDYITKSELLNRLSILENNIGNKIQALEHAIELLKADIAALDTRITGHGI